MLEEDRQLILAEADHKDLDFVIHKRLQARCTSVVRLLREIDRDTIEEPPGISWWPSDLPDHSRALITDHLTQATRGTIENLAAARIHLLELRQLQREQALEYENANRVLRPGENPRNPPKTLASALATRLHHIHMVGFFTNLSGVLDCLATTAVAVAALPLSVKKADYGKLRKLREKPGVLTTEQVHLIDTILTAEATAGPPGWRAWLEAMRNMLVHRPTRFKMNRLHKRSTGLLDPAGTPIHSAREQQMLVRAPEQSDIEALANAHRYPPVLEEDASTTLNGVFLSTKVFLEMSCERLEAFWTARRSGSPQLSQPRQQWTNVARDKPEFVGYAPGSVPFKPEAFLASGVFFERMKNASMANGREKRWQDPDAP